MIASLSVPKKSRDLCQTMWDIGGVVAKTVQGWRLGELSNMSPRRYPFFSATPLVLQNPLLPKLFDR
jgi:hypothetical protein